MHRLSLAIVLLLLAAPLARAAAPSSADLSAARAEEDPARFLSLLDDAVWAGLPEGKPERPPADLPRLRASLQSVQAMLVLVPSGDTVWAAVVTRDAVHTDSLDVPRTPVMAERLLRWRKDPAAHPFDPEAARVLYEDLFGALTVPLAGRGHVIVVADGFLRDVPFGALLMVQAPDDEPSAGWPYLANRFAFSHEATVFSRLGWPGGAGGDLLRLDADPDGSPPEGVDAFAPGSVVAASAQAAGSAQAVASLRWMRSGARGALLGGSGDAFKTFYARYLRERRGGRRPDVSAVRRTRGELIRAGEPVEVWALPRLWGAE